MSICKNGSALFVIALCCSLFFTRVVLAKGELKIGLYNSTGMKGIKECLDKNKGFHSEIISKLDIATLLKYDAVVIGSLKGGLPQAEWRDAMEVYVKSGGGVLLNHDSTGFRGWRNPLYPTLFQGIGRGVDKEVVVDRENSITKGLPEKFKHAYRDHVTLMKGIDGTVLIKDAGGDPVVITGRLGSGRVVGNGMVPGYAFKRPNGNQDKAPTGGEERLLLNIFQWLCEIPFTQLPSSEVKKRLRRFTNELNVRKSADVAAGNVKINKNKGTREWFHQSRFNEQGYVHPPIELLPGRFFMFDGAVISITNRGKIPRSYEETVAILRQMKWVGVTDIICFSGGLFRFNYPSHIPGAYYPSRARSLMGAKKGFDMLAQAEKACAEVGIGLWCFWHSNLRSLDKKARERCRKYMVRDAKGEIYSHYIDLLNPEVLKYSKKVIDELAEKYNKHGALKGVFLDELWHPFTSDYMEDDVDKFKAFCAKRFKATPPTDIAKKMGEGPAWHDPENIWWRRYLIWRNTHISGFTKKITSHANKKGLRIMTQPAFPLTWDMGWFWGVGNSRRMCASGNLLWSYEGRNNFIYEDYPDNRTIFGTHTNAHGGYSMVSLIRGNYGSLFAFCNNWLPILYGKSQKSVEVMNRLVRSNREWFGAVKIDETAVLVNECGLTLSKRNPSQIFKSNDALIRERLSYSVRTSMVLVDNFEYFSKYKVLIAPKYSLEYLPVKVYHKLVEYVENGGLLILCGGKVSTSAEDHTGVVDKNVELAGVKHTGKTFKTGSPLFLTDGKNKFEFPAIECEEVVVANKNVVALAKVKERTTPVVTFNGLKKGGVVSINFDITSLLADEQTVDKAIEFFSLIEKEWFSPAIFAKGNIKIVANLKKKNWVVATFLHRDVSFYDVNDEGKYPVSGKLYVDMEKLGIKCDRYRVYSLARDREMMPQGEDSSLFGEKYWTAKMLREQGVDVVLMPDSECDSKLNYKTDSDYVKRFVLPRWIGRRKTRSYEREIIAIAPVGEASMLEKRK